MYGNIHPLSSHGTWANIHNVHKTDISHHLQYSYLVSINLQKVAICVASFFVHVVSLNCRYSVSSKGTAITTYLYLPIRIRSFHDNEDMRDLSLVMEWKWLLTIHNGSS